MVRVNWLAKVVSPSQSRTVAPRFSPTSASSRASALPPASGNAPSASHSVRQSNGLKEFLRLLEEVKEGRLLDLGAASQATVSFFIQRGFRRVSAEDLLGGWREFELIQGSGSGTAPDATDPVVRAAWHSERATRFLDSALQYPQDEFHGILAWDIFEYLEDELLTRVLSRLYSLLRPGGVLLAIFHSRPPESSHNYRIVDGGVEMLDAPRVQFACRAFQNREVLNLFSEYRSSKTFVGRDQLREALILK
jgi:hypothetical protein